MIKSMTGYGIGETKRDGYHIVAELRTVNHRYTNIFLHLPGHLFSLEPALQKLIKERLQRGKIDLYLKIEEVSEEVYIPDINYELAKSYYNELLTLKKELGLEQTITLETIVSLPEVLKVKEAEQNEDLLHQIILETVEKCLDSLIQMRILEGKELYYDLVNRLERILNELKIIEERAPVVLDEYKKRLQERINEITQNITIAEERLAIEVALLAEKSCINEEIVRLKSHINQFQFTLEKNEAVGRKLDFIAQEMYREINTIGSKSSDTVIANSVVNIKSEIDKIREQVQNVE